MMGGNSNIKYNISKTVRAL